MSLFAPGLFAPGLFSSGLFVGGGSSESLYLSVAEFLDDLYNDELSDMFIGNRNNPEESRAKLLPLMNTGLLYAYSQYKIKLDDINLSVTSDVKSYTLSITNVLSILRVVNSYGRELTANEVQILGSTLYFPCPKDVTLQVEYKLRPTRMRTSQDDDEVYVELPDMLVPWLRAYVASRFFMAQKTEEAVAKGTHLLGQAKIMEELFVATNTTNEFTRPDNCRLQSRGFM